MRLHQVAVYSQRKNKVEYPFQSHLGNVLGQLFSVMWIQLLSSWMRKFWNLKNRFAELLFQLRTISVDEKAARNRSTDGSVDCTLV